MAISQRLDMRQGQSLVMTPQLQQAIKLLQLSNIELAEFVEAEIERNPLLEHGESSDRDDSDREMPERASKREELNLDDNSALNEAREAMDAPKEDLYDGGTTSDSATTANEMSGPSARTDWSQAGSGGSFSGIRQSSAAIAGDRTLASTQSPSTKIAVTFSRERTCADSSSPSIVPIQGD